MNEKEQATKVAEETKTNEAGTLTPLDATSQFSRMSRYLNADEREA